MTIGVKVGPVVDAVGAPGFFNAFFSTVVALLENGQRGSRFPRVTQGFYQGKVAAEDVARTRADLQQIRQELASHAPGEVVWSLEDPQARPPWGDDISADITSMANYFVSSTGRDLFDLLEEAFEAAQERNRSVEIVDV